MKHLLTLTILISLGLTACSPKSEELTTYNPPQSKPAEVPHYDPIPEQEFKWITEDGGESNQEFSPQIDILFIIDNSDSMKSTQDNLKRNIDKFTAGILQNRMIDYHIGVVSTWDSSERALKNKKDSYQVGDLRYVKDSSGKNYNQRFIDRKVSQSLIASTLDIGVMPYAQGGPEDEEFFSPLAAAIEKNGHSAVNEKFFRDQAQLVVIIITDADESNTSTHPDQMAQKLIDFKKGQFQKISVYGVLVKATDPDSVKDWALKIHPTYNPQCFNGKANNGTCTGFGPERLEQFIFKVNEYAGTPDQIRSKFIMGITSKSFGADLARIGSDITVKTLEKDILLSQRPRFDEKANQLMIRVRYGSPTELAAGRGQVIRQGAGGWMYNADDNSIHLSGHIKYQYVEGARFAVDLIPLTLKK